MAAKKARRKKKAKRKLGWGGKRPGAGRPKGSGTGPGPDARVNRVAVMLSNDELDRLSRAAKRRKLPLSTAAYRGLKRAMDRGMI